MRPLLRVSNIFLAKDKPILNGVSFELKFGEILVALGPSGAGKSSLLRCLNRLETIDSGEIFLDGRETRTIGTVELRRRVGMVFQTPALTPMTVREIVRMGPDLRGQTLAEDECEFLIREVGLGTDFLNRPAETLSVGERQRLAFAQTLANRPEVLLLDEPTSALDQTAVLKIENLIKTIHQDLKTGTLLVTHNVHQALRFNAQTLVMVDGKIVAQGNIQDLTRDAGNETAQKFFRGELDAK